MGGCQKPVGWEDKEAQLKRHWILLCSNENIWSNEIDDSYIKL